MQVQQNPQGEDLVVPVQDVQVQTLILPEHVLPRKMKTAGTAQIVLKAIVLKK